MATDKELSPLDRIDGELLELFIERMAAAEQSDPRRDPVREREIMNRIARTCSGDTAKAARLFFTELFDFAANRRRTPEGESSIASMIAAALKETPALFPQQATVACQGVEGSYAQQACDRFFRVPEIVYVRSFEGVCQAVEQGLCEYGVLPVENTLYGTVGAVYDLMTEHRFHIVRSLKKQISHALLALPGTSREELREVVSHDQALGQCSRFIKDHKLKVSVCENTAVAARQLAESGNRHMAAIASPECAALYGLEIVDTDIQNNANNYTRFICISRKLEIYPGADKSSIILSVPHRPGALYQLMAKFAALGINLSKLESRPVPGRDFEFIFYFDFDASTIEPGVVALLEELSAGPETFVFLGNYSEL